MNNNAFEKESRKDKVRVFDVDEVERIYNTYERDYTDYEDMDIRGYYDRYEDIHDRRRSNSDCCKDEETFYFKLKDKKDIAVLKRVDSSRDCFYGAASLHTCNDIWLMDDYEFTTEDKLKLMLLELNNITYSNSSIEEYPLQLINNTTFFEILNKGKDNVEKDEVFEKFYKKYEKLLNSNDNIDSLIKARLLAIKISNYLGQTSLINFNDKIDRFNSCSLNNVEESSNKSRK